MKSSLMTLKIQLPSGNFLKVKEVSKISVETTMGSVGLLPLRLDCVAGLVPGILTYESQNEGEVFIAIDEGILVKDGFSVVVSVRSAFTGRGLEQLKKTVEDEFVHQSDEEKNIQQVMAKMESTFIKRLTQLHHE